jgi:hypothetical protein
MLRENHNNFGIGHSRRPVNKRIDSAGGTNRGPHSLPLRGSAANVLGLQFVEQLFPTLCWQVNSQEVDSIRVNVRFHGASGSKS